MVPFKGIPMVERVIRNIADAGISHVIVNVHHYAEELTRFLSGLKIAGMQIEISDERGQLMDTGGAILQARNFFMNDEAFLVHNVDVHTNLDIPALLRSHFEEDCLVSMAVKERRTSRSLLFSSDGLLAGWRHNETGEERYPDGPQPNLKAFGNSCIQVINTGFFKHFPETKPISLVNMYLDIAKDEKIRAFIHNDDYWYDLGRYENFVQAEKEKF